MYAELQCKTNFSFLRGASEAEEYIQRASELGIPALAITDVNGVYALPRAFEVLRKFPHIKLISGCELKICDHAPITLLARDRKAYGLMCRILTAAHADKEKGMARLSLPEFLLLLEDPSASGLVALVADLKLTNLPLLKEAFADRLYIALSKYLDGMDEERTELAIQAAKRFGLKIVATNDVHYHLPERRDLQDALTCVREGVNLATAGLKLFPNEERYLKAPLQMRSLFRDLPEAIQNGLEIAASCTFSLSELCYQYPSEWIPQGYTAQRYLEELVWKGAEQRYKGSVPIEVEKQILHEFRLTERMGYADYFLTVYDIVEFAKRSNIYCQGRGSAANSVICYCLGITVIDPVRMNLLFERFISEDRGEPPDIDVDFEHERREEVIQYIYAKYGRDRAAMISAVRTYQRKSAFLEMSKAVGVPVGTISADELERDFEKHAGSLNSKRPVIERLAKELTDFPRHLSIHSCGFTLSALPLIETVPIEPARMEARTICQWDKNDLDTLKLIKVDVLALGFLTVIHKSCDLIGIHFWDIPQNDDPKVYGMMGQGDTIGTFQIESRAQISTLGVTQPRNFYDLVVEVALVRPGPNVGEMKSPYVTRLENARKGIPYIFDDPVTEKILGRTYGVPIFQEQVMKLAIEKAGFSPGEADQLRRAIAAWRSAEAVDALSGRFYDGLRAGGMSEAKAKEFFGYLKGFSAYGFPESHAASFAILSYFSAWLKFYHPAELLCGLINSQPMGFYSIDVLINDAKRHGVIVLPIDPNISVWDAVLEAPKTVRMGFRDVHGINESAFQALEKAREEKPFTSLHDFIARTQFKRDVIETLAMADVFKNFGFDQRHGFWSSIELSALFSQSNLPAQMSLFKQGEMESELGVAVFDSLSLFEGILEDYRGLGYSLRGNAMKGIRAENTAIPKTNSILVKQRAQGSMISYAGIVQVIQRPPTANGVAFITLEDEFGSVDLVLFEKIYEEYLHVIRKSRFLIITGKVERRSKSFCVLVKSVKNFEAPNSVNNKKPVKAGGHPRSIPKL